MGAPQASGADGASPATARSIGSGSQARTSKPDGIASVTSVGSRTTSAVGAGAAASAGRAGGEPLGQVGEGGAADPAADEERARDVEAKAVSERPEQVDRLARLERRERP